jgi:serine protease AprX
MSTPYPSGRIRWAVLALALLALIALMPASALAADRESVIVQMQPGLSPEAVIAQTRSAGGELTGRLPVVNGFSANVTAAEAEALKRAAGVREVTRDGGVEPQAIDTSKLKTAFPASINAPQAWNTSWIDATGRGVGVAVIDTGIDSDLPDFRAADSTSRVVASAVVNPDATTDQDEYGHGTHVAGILAGNSWRRDDGDEEKGRYVGIAPNANLISVKVSDDNGNASVLDVIRGLQFVVDHKAEYNIRVVNLSLEAATTGSYKTDPLDAAVENAWFSGIVVVAAAGNRGSQADAVSYAPGNDPYAITVGAVDDGASKADGDDARPSWSSRGTTRDGFAKPEVHAPGAGIVSNLAKHSKFAEMCASCVVDGDMIRAGGTSMAAPVVAGAVALMVQKAPLLTPDQIKGLLVAGSRKLNGKWPEIDLAGTGTLYYRGARPVANQGLTPNALVDAASGVIDYTRSSWSRSSWSRSSWSRSSWSCADCSQDPSDGVLPSRSSWSRSSWSMSWSK